MEVARRNIILVMFMMVPFGYLSFGIVHEGHHLAFAVSFVAIMGAMAGNRWLFAFALYLCAWYVFVCIYRLLYNIPLGVFIDATNALTYIGVGIAVYVSVIRSQMKLDTVLNFICTMALIQCALAFSQAMGVDPLLRFLRLFFNANALLNESTMIGSLGNNNFFGAFIAICLPLFFRGKWIYVAWIPVLFVALSKTTSAFVPALIGCLYYFYPRMGKRATWCMISAALAAGLFYAFFSHSNILENPRWTIWHQAVSIWASSIYTMTFGMGPGASWGEPYPLHNEWLTSLYQYGGIGMALLVGFVVNVPRKNRMLYAAFLIAAVNMFGNYSLHLAPSAFLIIIITGMIYREVRDERVREIRTTLDQIKSRKKK